MWLTSLGLNDDDEEAKQEDIELLEEEDQVEEKINPMETWDP